MKKTLIALSAIMFVTTSQAQLGGLLKKLAKKNDNATTTSSNQTTTDTKTEKPKELVNSYMLTDFQKANVGKIVVFNDYLGNKLDEQASDAATSTELKDHFVFRAYFDKNVRDAFKNGFDVVFSCEDVTVSLNKLRYYSSENFLKNGGPTGKTPGILAHYYSMADLKYEKFWKNEKIFSTGLLPKKEDSEYDAAQYMYFPVENAFRFFLNKLSSKLTVGKTVQIKIQFLAVNNEAADGWKAQDNEKTVLAEGTHSLKITANTKLLNNNVYRFEDEDYLKKPAVNETLLKAIKMLYPSEVAEVYKVQFYSDFTTKSNTYGPMFQWIKARVLLKAKSDGSFWSCKIEPHYKYNGSGFDNSPYEIIFINRHLVPSVGIPGAK